MAVQQPGVHFPIPYDHETFPFAQIQREARLGKFLNRHPALLRWLSHRWLTRPTRWRSLAETYALSAKYRSSANVMPSEERDLGYTGDQEIGAFLHYKRELQDGQTHQLSESGALYDHQLALLSEWLGSHAEIQKVLNFGVCYAYVDSELAKRFPAVEFTGVDRSPLTKLLNDFEFGSLSNMRFVTGDVLEHLASEPYPGGVFFHSRTAVVMSRPVLETIYQGVRNAGFEYIVGFEQFGLSRETLTPFVFDLLAKESVPFRAFMYIHNYPALLKAAGFSLVRAEVFKTDHIDQDYRVLAFVARRDR